jgi:hypothetical protein
MASCSYWRHNATQWQEAASPRLEPYDNVQVVQIGGATCSHLVGLQGTVWHHSVEMVFENDTWEILHFGTNHAAAKMRIHALAAHPNKPIRWLFTKLSDMKEY